MCKTGRIYTLFLLFSAILLMVGCNANPLGRFAEEKGYSLIYPLKSDPEPGDIYEETKSAGLARVIAYKDECAQGLEANSAEIGFGTYSVKEERGLEFLVGLSEDIGVPAKIEIEGAFKDEVSYDVSSDRLPVLKTSKHHLKEIFAEENLSESCQDDLREVNAVILSEVVGAKKFTFTFKGLKSGGIDIIFDVLAEANLKVTKKSEETLVVDYDPPMKLFYQRFTPEELIVVHIAEPPPPEPSIFTKGFFNIEN